MTLFQRFKRLTIWNKLGVVASIVGILAFILAVILLLMPERPKPFPHFLLSAASDEVFDDATPLTNSFLQPNPNSKSFSDGAVLIPVRPIKTNVLVQIFIKNDSDVASEDTRMLISMPKTDACVVGSDWLPAKHELSN